MGTLSLIFGTELRHRWRSWLALAVLVAVVGGLVLEATAAGRRTNSAFPHFVKTHGFDAVIYAIQPEPQIALLPGVNSATAGVGPFTGTPQCACTPPINPTDFGVIRLVSGGGSIYKLVSGRLPAMNSPDEVLASYTLEQDYGVHLGSVIRVPFYSASQLDALNTAIGTPPPPAGPRIAFRVVGFEATEFEFPSGSTPSYDLYTTRAFERSIAPKTANGYIYLVRLRGGASGFPQFDAQAGRLQGVEGVLSEDEAITAVENSIHPQALGWWILALLAGVVGVAVIGQALFRQSIVESEEYPTMSAMGADRWQLMALGLARTFVVAVAGAAGALILATLLSPIAPLGEARTAEISQGITFDTFVLPLGALATVFAVIGLGIWPALSAARGSRRYARSYVSRPSQIAARLAAVGAPPPAVMGVRHAIERRSGGATVPVGSALVGTILAVVALSGTTVFGASLTHLTNTPKLYGVGFQLDFTNTTGGTGGPDPRLLEALRHDHNVTAMTEGFAFAVTINRVSVGTVAGQALKGALPFEAVKGQLPRGDGEIGLGVTTMHQAGVALGQFVSVTLQTPSGSRRTSLFKVVSQVSFPELGGYVGLGTGAIFPLSGYEDAVCPPGGSRVGCVQAVILGHNGGVLATVAPGPHQQAVINHYLDTYQSIAATPLAPTSLINFGEAVNFPLIFGAILALFGAATLVHLLIVSVSRRRREIGLMKVLGFVNSQVGSSVAWQATTLAFVGVVVGVPLGIVAGHAAWSAFSDNLGAVPDTIVPVLLMVGLVAGVLVVANLIAIPSALSAARCKPEQLLRTQ